MELLDGQLDMNAVCAVPLTRAAQPMSDLDMFAGQVAHELRTPLGQVESIAEVMLGLVDADQGAQLRRWLELQLAASRHMRLILEQLLDVARASRPLQIETVDLTALCCSIRDCLKVNAPAAAIHWRIEDAMRVWADPVHAGILMRNLLSNAAKFTRDAATPAIDVYLTSAEDGLPSCVVDDNGAGFDAARSDEIFEPFVRLHRRSQYDGVGLGLAIAKRIVERHGGWIHASRSPDGGARFEFSFGPHRG